MQHAVFFKSARASGRGWAERRELTLPVLIVILLEILQPAQLAASDDAVVEARKEQALALKCCDSHHPSSDNAEENMEHLISATSRALERHGGDVLLACQYVLLRLYPDGPGASQGDQNGTDPVPEPHGGSIGEQTTADPSHTNSPSAKTSNNDEAVLHNSASELRESRFCWEPGSASNPSVSEHPLQRATHQRAATGRQTGSCAVCVKCSGRLSVQLPQQ